MIGIQARRVFGLVLVLGLLLPGIVYGQAGGQAELKAEQVFKNVQVLRGMEPGASVFDLTLAIAAGDRARVVSILVAASRIIIHAFSRSPMPPRVWISACSRIVSSSVMAYAIQIGRAHV